jgi:NADH dehydrogenase
VPPALGYWFARIVGRLVGDVIVTRAEIEGLMSGLLHVDTPPTGTVKLTGWARQNVESLGVRYASELRRREDRQTAYRA